MVRILKILLILGVFAGSFFIFGGDIGRVYVYLKNRVLPCSTPITYSIGSFDERFKISKETFRKAIDQAEQIWEKGANKNLFEASDSGGLKINLVYDHRQEATQKLQSLGLSISHDRASYQQLETQYDTLKTSYAGLKNRYDLELASFDSRQDAYVKEVDYWNDRGGAPKRDFERLRTEKTYLDEEFDRIKALEAELNQAIEKLNALAIVLNQIAGSLNLAVKNYNQIGESRGEEFDVGVYRVSYGIPEIDIYQFESSLQLMRVLAHEMGHALGLQHLEDPNAIMYEFNEGQNEKLSTADVEALKKFCRL